MEADYAAAYANLHRRHWWWRVREDILLTKARQLLRSRDGDIRILDVGCGAGLLFDALDSLGHVEGIESDRIMVEQSGRWRSRIHLGQLDTYSSDHLFDLILLLDVLEHTERPDLMLQQASQHLKPNGHLVLTVPAFQWLWTSHDDLNHHRKRYTADEVYRLMNEAGLTVIEARYLFQSLTIPKLLIHLKEIVVGRRVTLPRVPPDSLNRMLQRWFHLEDAIAGSLPFGSSVMAVAQGRHA